MNISLINKNSDDIYVELSVVLGTTNLRVQQLLKLGRGAVVELDKHIGDYVDIYANNTLIGKGEVVVTENDVVGISLIDSIKRN